MIWPFLFNLLLYAANAVIVPFIVLFYQDLGFSGAQIGILAGLPPLIVILAGPFWTGLADRTRKHKLIFSSTIMAGAIVLASLAVLDSFFLVLGAILLLNLFLAPMSPFADSATMFMLGDKKELYGRIRLGGTIGYAVTAALAGLLIESIGLRTAWWTSAGLLTIGFFISQKFRFGDPETPHSPVGFRELIQQPRWILFLILALMSGAALSGHNNFLFPHFENLGIRESLMGLTLLMGTTTEIPLMIWGDRILKRIGAARTLTIAMIITGLRLALLGIAQTPAAIIPMMIIGGFSFPLMWVAGVSYADQIAPEGFKTAAQGLFSATVFGIGSALGGFVGGPLFEGSGGRVLFLVYGSATLIGTLIVTLLQRRLGEL